MSLDTQQESKLRELLWLRHGCRIATLYGDDGEMQCSNCRIDFKRMTPNEIEEKLANTNKIDDKIKL